MIALVATISSHSAFPNFEGLGVEDVCCAIVFSQHSRRPPLYCLGVVEQSPMQSEFAQDNLEAQYSCAYLSYHRM